MDLIYDGTLTERDEEIVLSFLRTQRSHIVKVKDGGNCFWQEFQKWADKNMREDPYEGEDCMGGVYTKHCHSYAYYHLEGDPSHLLIGFRHADEADAFAGTFPGADRNPFKVIIHA